MKIIAADDEQYSLERLVESITEAAPDAEIASFENPKELLSYVKEHAVDVAFLDIEMGTVSGIDVAKQLKIWYPRVNIIFVTAYNKYMADAFKLRVSGYVGQPVRTEDIIEELNGLRIPVMPPKENVLTAKCFGTFDVFMNGKRVEFERSKTKEMLAYLIDRRGSEVTSGELRAVLWEDAETDENTRSYLSKIQKDLKHTLAAIGMENVFLTSWGKYAIDDTKISCDYYDYLDNKPEGVRAYNGEYMSQYSWGEVQNVLLRDKMK